MYSGWWTLSVSLVLGAAALAFYWWRRYSTHFACRGVPHKRPLPFVGNMLTLALSRKSMSDTIAGLYRDFDPHPYAGVFQFMTPLVFIRDPEVIRTITVKDFDHFTDHVGFASSDKVNPVLSRSLFSLKGKEWHDMRTTLSPAFTSMKMRNMFTLMAEIGQQMVDYLTKKTDDYEASSNNDNIVTLEMKDFFTRITNDIIATTAFGVKVDSLSEPNNVFYTMGRDLTTFRPIIVLGYLTFPNLMELLGIPFFDAKTVGFFRSMVSQTIQTREKEGIIRHDMIHLLMQARHGELSEYGAKNGITKNNDRRLTDDDIAAQAMVFFFGGFETVSTLTTFCSYLLATHADVQRRLQEEVDDVMRESSGQPTYEQLMGCQYLDMVVSETLRMYAPGAALDRKCVRSYQLPATDSCPGFELRPGDGIWIPVHGIHHDPKFYPDPERFDPERFNSENKHLIQPFTYYPFGSGPRMCIAQRFALMETKVVLLYLLSKFNLEVVAKTPVPLKIRPNNFNLSIEGGAWLGVKNRS